MNVRLLRKVQKAILKSPRQFHMGRWFTVEATEFLKRGQIPKCGTAACIAGWAIALKDKNNPREGYEHYLNHDGGAEEMGAAALGLNSYQSDSLFFVSSWPDKFRDKFMDDGTAKSAKVAAARIEHFIKTKGEE